MFMKRSELFFSAIGVPIDFLMLLAAAIGAFLLRDVLPAFFPSLPPRLFEFSLEQYVIIALMVIPFFLLLYALEGLYTIRSTRKSWQEVYEVARATTIGLVIIIVILFLNREMFSSRVIILTGWALAVVLVSGARLILRYIQHRLLVQKGIGVYRVLLVGNSTHNKNIKHHLKTNPQLGYRIVAHVDNAQLSKIKEIHIKKGIDEIIVGDTSLPDSAIEKLIDYGKINNIGIKLVPTSLQTSLYQFSTLAGEPIMSIKHTPLDGWGKIAKRTFDIISSGSAILLVSPIMALIALLIKIEDPDGPIVFKNERIGSDGRKFFVYKFRYMKWKCCITKDNPRWHEALALEKELIEKLSVREGPLYKIKNDPRKTRIGTFIEKYSLDELPQFFNVLFGSMSLVGPRPHQEREVIKYREYHRQLLTIKPGLTGMAQVSGRSDLDFEDEYKLDVFYIEHWSLWLDIIICIKTVNVLFARRKNN